jgi:integrase
MAKLTVKAVEYAKPGPARREVPDGLISGLYLVVQPSGSKSWAYRYRANSKTRKLTLGRYPKVGLAGARELAQKAELEIRQGRDPADKAPKREEKTVEALARDFIAIYAMHHNRLRTWKERARILGLEQDPDNGGLRLTKSKGEVLSRWQHRSIQSITGEDVIDLTDAIVARGAKIAANRTLAAVRAMFLWALSRRLLKASPCAGLRPPGKEQARRRVLTPAELRAVWRAAEHLDGAQDNACRPKRDAYRLLILSGQRKSQICLARLEHFDLRQNLWTLPPEEGAKSEDFHLLPITPEIAATVKACPYAKGYLFSTTMGAKPLHIGAKLKRQIDGLALEELRKEAAERGEDPARVRLEPWTNHDLRRTFRTGLSALAVPEGDLVRELIIGHRQPGVHSVYDVHSYLDEKRVALELWAARVRDIVSEQQQNVVPLKAKVSA